MNIVMPKLSDMPDEKGTVVEITVAAGDVLAPGTIVMTVEMAKTTVEIESLHNGAVARILVEEGAEVSPGQVLIELTATPATLET